MTLIGAATGLWANPAAAAPGTPDVAASGPACQVFRDLAGHWFEVRCHSWNFLYSYYAHANCVFDFGTFYVTGPQRHVGAANSYGAWSLVDCGSGSLSNLGYTTLIG